MMLFPAPVRSSTMRISALSAGFIFASVDGNVGENDFFFMNGRQT